jgi:hypothetical protein
VSGHLGVQTGRSIAVEPKRKKLLVEEFTQETKTEKETSRSRVEADENKQQTFQKTLRVAAPPLKNNNSTTTTTTTKMFADIVQKTQTKPPFDNRNFSFPKSATTKKNLKKKLQKLKKICIKAEEERKQINFFSKKLGFIFFRSSRAMQKYAKRFRATKSKAVVGKETTKSSATPCTYTKQPQTIFYSTIPHLFFSLLPGDSNVTDCREIQELTDSQ